MARRQAKEREFNIVSILLGAPWQISAVLAVVGFGLMKWVIPSQLNSPALVGFGQMFSSLAPLGSGLIMLIAAVSYF